MEILNIHFLSPIYYFTFKNNLMAESFLCFQNHFYLKFLVSKHNVGGYTYDIYWSKPFFLERTL